MLYLIGEIGQLLLDINLKASADNWIGYLNISQKFSKHLNSGFNNENVVKFFTNEILHNMQKLSDLVYLINSQRLILDKNCVF